MANEAINKSIYQKLSQLIPGLRGQLAKAKRHPMVNKPLRLHAGLNLNYLAEDKDGNSIIALTEFSGQGENKEFKSNMTIRVAPQSKTAEVLTLQNAKVAFQAYGVEDGKIVPMPLNKYMNEYLDMRLDEYSKHNLQVDFSVPTETEPAKDQPAPEDVTDELDELRAQQSEKSNDKGMTR